MPRNRLTLTGGKIITLYANNYMKDGQSYNFTVELAVSPIKCEVQLGEALNLNLKCRFMQVLWTTVLLSIIFR